MGVKMTFGKGAPPECPWNHPDTWGDATDGEYRLVLFADYENIENEQTADPVFLGTAQLISLPKHPSASPYGWVLKQDGGCQDFKVLAWHEQGHPIDAERMQAALDLILLEEGMYYDIKSWYKAFADAWINKSWLG